MLCLTAALKSVPAACATVANAITKIKVSSKVMRRILPFIGVPPYRKIISVCERKDMAHLPGRGLGYECDGLELPAIRNQFLPNIVHPPGSSLMRTPQKKALL